MQYCVFSFCKLTFAKCNEVFHSELWHALYWIYSGYFSITWIGFQAALGEGICLLD